MTEGSGTPQFGIVNPRLRTVLAFSGPVLRGCALRFAPCARHFSPSGLRCSQAHSRLSLPYWGLRTGLRFAGPVFRGCGALRAVPQFSMVVPLRSQARLRHSLLHWAYFGLFRALRAASVRPSPLHPFGASTATACFRHWRRPSCAPQRANHFHAFKYFINSLLNCARRYLLMGRRSPLFSSNSQ